MKYFVFAYGETYNELGSGFEFDDYSSYREAVNAKNDFKHASIRKYGNGQEEYFDDARTTDYKICSVSEMAEELISYYGYDISDNEKACEKFVQFVRMLTKKG